MWREREESNDVWQELRGDDEYSLGPGPRLGQMSNSRLKRRKNVGFPSPACRKIIKPTPLFFP